ncbi:MAG: sulfatase family protein [Planctomycetota bacterium]|jgi:arylsulfatase A-like enzyme
MDRRKFLKEFGAVVTVACTSGLWAAQRAEKRKVPNILYIMSDDHAAHAISAYKSRLAKIAPTPNIDRLANEGILFENCFCTNSICVPSRATILTGQYSQTNGALDLGGRLEPQRQYLPRLMKQAGYETAMIGKWHLKQEPAFDYYCVLPGQGSYFNPILRESGGQWPKNEKRFASYDSHHSSDVITNTSLKWLKGRDTSKPFFLMHHYKAPHDNFENAERYDWLFEYVDIPEPASLWQQPKHGSKATEGTGTSIGKRNKRRNMGHHMFVDQSLSDERYKRTAYQRYLKKYLRCVRGVDDNLGRLFKYLDDSGQINNTVIIYTSDQGMMLGEHDYIDKRWMYEESMRMPFLVRYPGMIKPGTRTDEIINNTDFAPTILALAGVKAPGYMQGRSFVPLLQGKTPADWPRSTYYRYWMHMAHHDNPAHFGVRTKEYKLMFFYGQNYKKGGQKPTRPGWELYDMKNDPYEMNNLYGKPKYTAVIKGLKAELMRLRKKHNETDDRYPHIQRVIDEYWNS